MKKSLRFEIMFCVVVSKIFYVHPEPWGNDPIWTCAYFSKWVGLKPPPGVGHFDCICCNESIGFHADILTARITCLDRCQQWVPVWDLA